MVSAAGWAASHFLSVCWNLSTFPQVVGWLGAEFFCSMPRAARRASKALRPPRPPESRVVQAHGVVGECRGGEPVLFCGFVEGGHDDGAGDAPVGGDGQGVAGMVVEPGDDLGCGACGERPVAEVGLPHLVGQIGLEADIGRPGPHFGAGVDDLAAVRSRQIVDGDTAMPWRCWRCQQMVWGPASRPWEKSSARRFTTSSTTSSDTLAGEVRGRRDRGSNAASPSVRYRVTQRDTVALETP